MARITAATGLVLGMLCALHLMCEAQFVVETNSMRVREPESIAGEFDIAIGDFGVPLYGATLVGQVVLPPPGNKEACAPFPKPLIGKTPGLPVILLVSRGSCYFIEKAYNAEKAGAAAVLVMDNKVESLLTMSNPEDRPELAKLKNDISIPAALVQKSAGDRMAAELTGEATVIVELDWTDSITHPDNRVEWQLWTSSSDGCGRPCERQGQFKRDFQDTAVNFEKQGYTAFEPHFMHQKCTTPMGSQPCQDCCLNNGRYCAYDGILDEFSSQFKPRQVVIENKRQMCVAWLARNQSQPWLWWEFASGYAQECTMANGKFNNLACAEGITQRIGLDPHAVAECMGDDDTDANHWLLQAEMEAQGSASQRASLHVLLLPTVVINSNQYRGRLDVTSITRALCSGFDEATEPEVCLSGSLQQNDCLSADHGCWTDATGQFSACVDTFRGRTCKCPPGFRGDGLTCTDIDECAEGSAGCDQTCSNTVGGWQCACGPGFLLIGGKSQPGQCLPKDMCSEDARSVNGGCEMGCSSVNGTATCLCPMKGLQLASDLRHCENVNECGAGNGGCEQLCEDSDPRVTGTAFTCTCREGFMVNPANKYKCVQQVAWLQSLGLGAIAGTGIGWASLIVVVAVAAAVTLVLGVAVYHFRMRAHAQQQIKEIMKQYMPLEGNGLEDDALLSPTIAAHRSGDESSSAPQPGGSSAV